MTGGPPLPLSHPHPPLPPPPLLPPPFRGRSGEERPVEGQIWASEDAIQCTLGKPLSLSLYLFIYRRLSSAPSFSSSPLLWFCLSFYSSRPMICLYLPIYLSSPLSPNLLSVSTPLSYSSFSVVAFSLPFLMSLSPPLNISFSSSPTCPLSLPLSPYSSCSFSASLPILLCLFLTSCSSSSISVPLPISDSLFSFSYLSLFYKSLSISPIYHSFSLPSSKSETFLLAFKQKTYKKQNLIHTQSFLESRRNSEGENIVCTVTGLL